MSPIGVSAALQAASDPTVTPRRTIFDEFSLNGKVAVVTGGNRGLGLEMALALCEAGAKVYAFDLPEVPGEEFTAASEYAKKLGGTIKYVCADVTRQKDIWDKFAAIGDAEGRMDICIAAAGFGESHSCLTYEASDFQRVMDVNTNGVLYTAQGAGQQMARFGTPGSIILIASMAGSITLRGNSVIAYQSSKAAVLQMARSMACELGSQKIRVNSISPGKLWRGWEELKSWVNKIHLDGLVALMSYEASQFGSLRMPQISAQVAISLWTEVIALGNRN